MQDAKLGYSSAVNKCISTQMLASCGLMHDIDGVSARS